MYTYKNYAKEARATIVFDCPCSERESNRKFAYVSAREKFISLKLYASNDTRFSTSMDAPVCVDECG